MGCVPSRKKPPPSSDNNNNNKDSEAASSGAPQSGRILMINNSAKTGLGSDAFAGGATQLENLNKSKCKRQASARDRQLCGGGCRVRALGMLLLRGRGGLIHSAKIDTCDRLGGGQVCDDTAARCASRGGPVLTVAEVNTDTPTAPLLLLSPIPMISSAASDRKRKSSKREGSSSSKMHIGEARAPSSSSEDSKRLQSNATIAAQDNPAMSETSISPAATPTITVRAGEASSASEVRLFTSVQQLCSEIIKRDLLRRPAPSSRDLKGRVLCLFMFGCQGSAKGEVAYELVEHSALHEFLRTRGGEREERSSGRVVAAADCPLYHQIDVAAVIAANIDQRISEYNQLAAQASRIRLQQMALYNASDRSRDKENNQQEQSDGSAPPTPDIVSHMADDSDRPSLDGSSESSFNPSVSSLKLASSTLLRVGHSEGGDDDSLTDESSLITLTTKQRSILQLKLMKYFNSVTSKWVFGLVQREIERLERKLEESPRAADSPDRVYLINLVPNQLSLFKSCLYLKQSVQLREFRYPVWALKFERRTNIKLLHKERASPAPDKQVNSPTADSANQHSLMPNLKISSLKLPKLNMRSSSTSLLATNKAQAPAGGSSPSPSEGISGSTPAASGASELGAVATNLLANGVNEKLGPKFNESFAQQFKGMNRLSLVRYNPLRDYNYAQQDHDESAKCWINSSIDSTRGDDERQSDETRTAPPRQQSAGSGDEPNSPTGRLKASNRLASSSMHHIQSLDSGGGEEDENLGEIQHRLSLSRISTSARHHDIFPNNRLTPSSQVSFLSSTSSLVSSFTQSSGESDAISARTPRSPLSRAIKWAVGLELCEPGGQAEEDSTNTKGQSAGETSTGSAAKSPSITYSSQHKRRSAGCYQLLPARIAYANDQSQVQYELKRTQPRLVKLKSHSDVLRLLKLIVKAKRQVGSDCDSWLYAALARDGRLSPSTSATPPTAPPLESVALANQVSIRKRQSSARSGHTEINQNPVLIVYTVRVDVSRLKAGNFQYPSHFATQPPVSESPQSVTNPSPQQALKHSLELVKPILTLNGALDDTSLHLRVGSGNSRPTSARSAIVSAESGRQRPKRRVQFKLSQAPLGKIGPSAEGHLSMGHLKLERRLWYEESVFLSHSDGDNGAENVCLLDLLAALMRFCSKRH